MAGVANASDLCRSTDRSKPALTISSIGARTYVEAGHAKGKVVVKIK
jgi:hypothetical protein